MIRLIFEWLVIIFIILFVSALNAEAELIRVKFLLVEDPNRVSEEYLASVTDGVSYVYKRDLGLRLRVRSRIDNRVSHTPFLHLENRYEEFKVWKAIFKEARKRRHQGRKPRLRWLRVVIIPPYFDAEGCSYGAGLANGCALAVVRQYEACSGDDRFHSDWITVSHELAHLLGALHWEAWQVGSNIMSSDALIYHPMGFDLHFVKATKNDIRRAREENT